MATTANINQLAQGGNSNNNSTPKPMPVDCDQIKAVIQAAINSTVTTFTIPETIPIDQSYLVNQMKSAISSGKFTQQQLQGLLDNIGNCGCAIPKKATGSSPL